MFLHILLMSGGRPFLSLCFPLFLLTLAHTHRHQLISFETPPPHIGNLPGNSHFSVGGWNHTSIGLWQLFSEYKPLLHFFLLLYLHIFTFTGVAFAFTGSARMIFKLSISKFIVLIFLFKVCSWQFIQLRPPSFVKLLTKVGFLWMVWSLIFRLNDFRL